MNSQSLSNRANVFRHKYHNGKLSTALIKKAESIPNWTWGIQNFSLSDVNNKKDKEIIAFAKCGESKYDLPAKLALRLIHATHTSYTHFSHSSTQLDALNDINADYLKHFTPCVKKRLLEIGSSCVEKRFSSPYANEILRRIINPVDVLFDETFCDQAKTLNPGLFGINYYSQEEEQQIILRIMKEGVFNGFNLAYWESRLSHYVYRKNPDCDKKFIKEVEKINPKIVQYFNLSEACVHIIKTAEKNWDILIDERALSPGGQHCFLWECFVWHTTPGMGFDGFFIKRLMEINQIWFDNNKKFWNEHLDNNYPKFYRKFWKEQNCW